jgi:hypothetical protein
MRSKLTYANVMVTLLLFVVLGGGAYAATQLPKNSVGAKQLKKGAVTKAKIQQKTLKALEGAIGATGPAGPAGASGAPGGTVPAGTTLRGVAATGISGGLVSFEAESFGGSQLAFRPTANIVPEEAPPTQSCPGSVAQPEATAGNFCFYVKETTLESEGIIGVTDPATPGLAGIAFDAKTKTFTVAGSESKVSKFGFQLTAFSEENTEPQVSGSWAVSSQAAPVP